MIRAGVVGGAGVTGGELLRLLLAHADVELVFVQSTSNQSNPVHHVHRDLIGLTNLAFSGSMRFDVDVIFLCLAHGDAKRFMQNQNIPEGVTMIDLSQDFRLVGEAEGFVYGLPELQKPSLKRVREMQWHVANPGCFATCIQFGLLPLAHAGLLHDDIHTSAITGSTGAGQTLEPTVHFSWRFANMQVYHPFTHRHLPEIRRSLLQLQPDFSSKHFFIPYRGSFTRGIIASSYIPFEKSNETALRIYREYYASHPFVTVVEQNPDLKLVVNTNRCLTHPQVIDGMLLVISVLDNLIKGAAGQAVQNMNIVFGLEEEAGLKLKSVVY